MYLHNNEFISLNKKKFYELYNSYAMRKSVKLPFHGSNNTFNEPLPKIHCGLWGFAAIKFFQVFKYYVLFMDDFPRFSWLDPL